MEKKHTKQRPPAAQAPAPIAPRVTLLDSEFDAWEAPPLTLQTEDSAPRFGDSWRIGREG